MPKRSKHCSIEVDMDASEDSRLGQASVARHRLHIECEYYHMGSDSEGSTAVGEGITRPTHYRVRTKSKSERQLGK